jgi:hypothetical protein
MLDTSLLKIADDVHTNAGIHYILDKAQNLSSYLKLCGYIVPPFSELAEKKLGRLPESQIQKVNYNINALNQILALSLNNSDTGTPEIPLIHPERNLIEKALQFYNLKIRHDFWATVQPHDIVEIYNDEGIQIFRSFNFFETSGYSLTDLLVNEWYVLWERPKFILQEIFRYSNGIFSGEMNQVTRMAIPKHVVKEIYSGTDEMLNFTPRSTLVEFGYVCPLYTTQNPEDSKAKGMIVTSTASTNTMGAEETKKVIIF